GTTWYLNGTDSQGLTYEKEVKANGTTEHKHYLSAAGITFALYVKREGNNLNGKPATSTSYFHHDHLGSIAVITDESGTVVERLAYDPWGKRRNANGTPDPLDALYGVATDRGYTMHEHLDEMGIVHMNGRIYDPLIGRFMSADPFIQAPGNLQSYNRYAYVLNNPLAYTDPSGYFFKKFFKSVVIRIAAAVADVMGCSGYCTMAVNAYQGYKSGGIAGMVVSFIPGGDTLTSQIAISAASGCVVAYANGGNCGRGAGSSLLEYGANSMGWRAYGAALGGCLAAANQGGSCRHGAGNAFAGYAARYVAEGVRSEFAAYKRAEEHRASLVAVAPAAAFFVPAALEGSAILMGWVARGLAFTAVADSMRKLVGVLSVEGEGTSDAKPPLSDYKDALDKVHDEVGKLPKGEEGKFGSPQAGDSKKGYRLDPPHDGAAQGDAESKHHFNWWDYTNGKRGKGGRSGAIPIGN
ncbi:RHS repeat-associated core domain-containing protein, partial [Hydrogenophaga sp.]|uniref:RHS repeat-associated core domain-containing protein n=1 Tax=Hydrogenophaga sp. TaxID=1904254 RepID=UPI003F718F9E